MNVCFVTDPLTTTAGAVRPAILLAKEFVKNNHSGMLITPRINEKIKDQLQKSNIDVKVIGYRFSLIPSFPTLDAWFKSLIRHKVFHKTSDIDIVVNTSSCIIIQACVYYGQGIMINAFQDMVSIMPAEYRFIYEFVKHPLRKLEQKFVRELRESSSFLLLILIFVRQCTVNGVLELME